MRKFDTGATRDSEEGKFDYEGFLSPQVVERFAAYMHKHRKQADGQLRASDNWQKGIPRDAYMKSMHRHMLEVWKAHRELPAEDLEESLCAMLFNVQGYLFEVLNDPYRVIRASGDAVCSGNSSIRHLDVSRPERDKQVPTPILDRKTGLDGSETTESNWEDEGGSTNKNAPGETGVNHTDSSWGV